MNEKQYLDLLEQELLKLNKKERADIRRDFEEYFENGRQEGKSTEEIIKALGAPNVIAEELLSAYTEDDFVEEISMEPSANPVLYRQIDAKIDGANFIIYPTDRDQAYIEIKDKDDRTEAVLEVMNDTLHVKVKRQETIKKFFFITIVGNIGKSEVILYVPRLTYEQIKVYNDDGFIKLSELQVNRSVLYADNGRVVVEQVKGNYLKAESDNGRVIISNCSVDYIEAETDNGRIISEFNTTQDLQLETDNGRIELQECTGTIKAKTSNGRIEAQMSSVKDKMKLKTSNGSITLKSPNKLEDVLIDASTNWGSVSIYGQSNKTYKHGTGEVLITLASSNGKIVVESAENNES